MADFLTRLIERSRGLAPQLTQGVEPIIAPFYAAGPNTPASGSALPEVMDEEVISIADHRQAFAPLVTEAGQSDRPLNISIAPLSRRPESRDKVSPEIKPAGALADQTQRGQLNQPSGSEPLSPRTPKAMLPPARPGLTATDDGQSVRANVEPLMIRPQIVARADESNLRAGITTNGAANKVTSDQAAPVIRVTIGRVDVRAVNAPARPVRRVAMPGAPKLSLEDYLRSRSGRK